MLNHETEDAKRKVGALVVTYNGEWFMVIYQILFFAF